MNCLNSTGFLTREEIGNNLQGKLSITNNVDIAATEEETFGAESNPTENPIGGNENYQSFITQIDYLVKTREELLDALSKAQIGQNIYIDDTAEIDLTGYQNIVIPAGVTLASGRGKIGSLGALLFSDQLDTLPLFKTGGTKVRITGLRLRGPDPERRNEQLEELDKQGRYYSIPNSQGIQSSYARLEVDNCELSGWSHAAIFLINNSYSYIHHNSIHHNQRWGLGYGVCLDQAKAFIEANLFDWYRHAIAGTGRPGTSYEASYNLILENANSYAFDMHGGVDREDGTDIAGDYIKIHHNTFRATDVYAILINGRPTQKADIHHNWFLHNSISQAVIQQNGFGNFHVFKNLYSENKILQD
ncbi:MAG: right-handed parallel beta-helix repeat-containing protein [Candidatus Jettenia sp.]|nr:right-handed parallel beta-helix repeat-containing protein [Candidatus Jettenia sp.]